MYSSFFIYIFTMALKRHRRSKPQFECQNFINERKVSFFVCFLQQSDTAIYEEGWVHGVHINVKVKSCMIFSFNQIREKLAKGNIFLTM